MEAGVSRHPDEVVHQPATDAGAGVLRARRTPSPRPWCGTPHVPCTATVTRNPPPRRRSSPRPPRTRPTDPRSNAADPRVSVGTRSNVLVWFCDLDVVDRHDRWGIFERGEADRDRRRAAFRSERRVRHDLAEYRHVIAAARWLSPCGRYTRRLVRGSAASRRVPRYRYKRCSAPVKNALLAQSVEHSHGKAGVVGSIPTEGSTKWSGIRPATSQTPGGVAQLVRASGS